MKLHKESDLKVRRLAILAGSFHPPTKAHLALARSALVHADAVLWVIPGQLPHKEYTGTTREQRLELVLRVAEDNLRFLVGVSEGGLMAEIVQEAKLLFPDAVEMFVICGRDAAERFEKWPYATGITFESTLEEFQLLVASREGGYQAPQNVRSRVRHLALDGDWEGVSSTEVRRRIAAAEPWGHLVPEALVEMIGRYYS